MGKLLNKIPLLIDSSKTLADSKIQIFFIEYLIYETKKFY